MKLDTFLQSALNMSRHQTFDKLKRNEIAISDSANAFELNQSRITPRSILLPGDKLTIKLQQRIPQDQLTSKQLKLQSDTLKDAAQDLKKWYSFILI